jgi:hypothetical protein
VRKTHDYEHPYEDHDTNPGICRVLVYEGVGRRAGVQKPVVVAPELPKNKGASVANTAKLIAADLIKIGVLSEACSPEPIETEPAAHPEKATHRGSAMERSLPPPLSRLSSNFLSLA